ncbi:MAG: methyl-accepting chemotaxis protein [Lachnospiraceae bacterium]|nr:methyl-accepting chemotaxis protein [Lachnospiraceae bacterium]
MKKSIKLRILSVLVVLLFIYAANAILSGVTNNQVELSTTLLADYALHLSNEQALLEENMATVETSALQSLADNSFNSKTTDACITATDAMLENATNINTYVEKFSKAEMNSALKEAYSPYYQSILAYVKQAQNMISAMEKSDISTLKTSYKALTSTKHNLDTTEVAFEETLSSLVAHEDGLIQNRVKRATSITIGMAVVFVIAMVIIVYVILHTVLRPLENMEKKLSHIISDLHSGNGDLTNRLDYLYKDEVGRIALGINSFIEELQTVIQSIKSGSDNIHTATLKMDENITSCESTSSSIFDGLSEISANMEEISATLQNIDESTSDILDSAKQIYSDSDSNSLQVKELLSNAEEVKVFSEANKTQTQSMIEDISTRMEESIEKSNSVEQIRELTNNILSISSQTNLLALNASIEAARAGDSGRGFAVVATEIQSLAEDTKNIATDIQDTNIIVLDAVHELVANANELLEYITTSILGDYDKFVENAVDNKNGIQDIYQLLIKFSDHAKHMQEQTEALSDGITEISVASENSVSALVKSTEDMNNLHVSVSEIQNESNQNSFTVNELNSEVEKFKQI